MSGWKLSARRKGLRPLAIDSRGLLCYAHGELYRVTYDLQLLSFIGHLPVRGLIGRIGASIRLVDRILRLAPNHALVVDGALYIARKSEIWRCDLTTGQVSLDFVIPDGRRALSFGRIDQPDGEISIVFGEYFANPLLGPVRIWGRSSRDHRWTVRGEFAAGEIEHVHSVTAIGDRIWLLCGDFDHSAGIWVSDPSLSTFAPCLRGSQAYRAAWITELGGRLFYATDTQLETNHVVEITIENGIGKIRELASIDGSSIYCGRGSEEQFFSTTVEGGVPTGNFLYDILDVRRGPAIHSTKAKIMRLNASGICEEIYSAEKDAWPFRLAQFGAFTFPSGEMPNGIAVAYGTALRGVDDTCLVFMR